MVGGNMKITSVIMMGICMTGTAFAGEAGRNCSSSDGKISLYVDHFNDNGGYQPIPTSVDSLKLGDQSFAFKSKKQVDDNIILLKFEGGYTAVYSGVKGEASWAYLTVLDRLGKPVQTAECRE
jgi:hypothetical protein